MMREDVLALADELEGMDCREGCRTCPADGTEDCRGDLSCEEAIARAASRRIREIAEHDACEEAVTTVSAYDLLPEDEREAIAWVREHGGLDSVKKLLDWVVGHCSTRQQLDFDFWLSGRVMHELGFDEDMADRDEVERRLLARLMPEGMEWPRYDTGELVDFGDEVARDDDDGAAAAVDKIVFHGSLWQLFDRYRCEINEDMMGPGERVNRPAPKVFDADGVEIRVVDVLYRKSDGHMVKVAEVYEKTFTDADGYVRPGDGFTHRAPVLASDGRPLHEGEHVYHVETGAELVVKELPKPGEYQAVVVFAPPASHPTSFDPDLLTHQRPVLDADGVEIKQGDTVYVLGFGEPLTVRGFAADGRVLMDYHSDDSFGYSPENLTHTKPEPPDTYAKLYEDVHDERCSSEEFVLRCRAGGGDE